MESKKPQDSDKTSEVNGVSFTHRDLFIVVDDFYTRIQSDPVLKIPFRSVHDWPEHIERLTHFWWVKFGGKPYLFNNYNPVQKHFFAGFNRELLARWLSILHQTLNDHLAPEQCRLWKTISERMGEGLAIRNEQLMHHYEAKKLSKTES